MKIVVFGGCGFIGTNLCIDALARGWDVVCVDNMDKTGTGDNLRKIERHSFNRQFIFYRDDIRESKKMDIIASVHYDADLVVNLAAQVAVTTSIIEPFEDMQHNIIGNLNILEALREFDYQGVYIYASTNKVYGHKPVCNEIGEVDESSPLELYTPYGCSKGAADQYTLDYHRIYGIKTVVMRQSCIYGEYQYGVEDQGWAAHFAISMHEGRPITIYGDGMQARDLLHVSDLIRAYWECLDTPSVYGQAFNMGGGIDNGMTIYEYIELLKTMLHKRVEVTYDKPRQGDQKYFVACTDKFRVATGWEPKINVNKGTRLMLDWIIGEFS